MVHTSRRHRPDIFSTSPRIAQLARQHLDTAQTSPRHCSKPLDSVLFCVWATSFWQSGPTVNRRTPGLGGLLWKEYRRCRRPHNPTTSFFRRASSRGWRHPSKSIPRKPVSLSVLLCSASMCIYIYVHIYMHTHGCKYRGKYMDAVFD